jgi:hypothetical protein
MVCRSCSLGPSPARKASAKPRTNVVITKPNTGKTVPAGKKTSVPTRSPARTFNNVGE